MHGCSACSRLPCPTAVALSPFTCLSCDLLLVCPQVADIWSCGVMLYVMLCGRYPFESPKSCGGATRSYEIFSMLEKMVGQKYVIPDQLGVSAECRELLRQMLLPDPRARITMEGITQNAWFK